MPPRRDIEIRRLEPRDAPAWREMWAGYLRFYRRTLPDELSDRTFERLHTGSDGMCGLVGTDDAGTAVGFAHLVFHPSTWSPTTKCYLEDLFVAPAWRGRGVGQALISRSYSEADRRGASGVYWHTQEYNAPARALYDQVAHRTSFVRYDR